MFELRVSFVFWRVGAVIQPASDLVCGVGVGRKVRRGFC